MAFKLRRGLESERTTITPLEGEPLYTTDTHLLYIGDGSTAGGNLVGGASYFSAMTDVDVSGVLDGYFLTYSAATGKWVITGTTGVGGITELSGLTDVDTSTALNGQVLTYVSASDTWSAITSPAGITDHGLLDGLGDDDHTQYHTDTRAEIWLTGNNHDVISATTITATTYNAGVIKFDVDYNYAVEEGELRWNSTQSCLEVGMPGGEVVQQIGQEFLVRVRNNTDSIITNGTVIMNTGSHAGHPTISPATADASTPTMQVGMATEDIGINSYGFVCLQGFVNGVDTTSWAEGTSLYLSASTPADGSLTDTPPTAPNHNAWMCVVTIGETTSGQVYFKPVLPITLSNISDVNGTTPDATNKYLVWDNANSFWDAGQIYFSGVTNTGHTHTESDITDLGDYALNISFTSHTAQTGIHFTEASIDHTNIQNVGTNTHSQIDSFITFTESHIDDNLIHFDMGDVETQITGTNHNVLSATTITATTYQGIDFSVITNTGHTHTLDDIIGEVSEAQFIAHTGNTDIHFEQTDILFENIQNTGHTHDHNTELTGIQGGESGQHYHLNQAEYNAITGFSYSTNDPTGFVNLNNDSTLTWDDGTRTLTITPTGTTFDVMINGKLFKKTEESIVIPAIEGLTHIVYDSGGTLTNLGLNAGPDEFIVYNAYVCNIYWSTGQTKAVGVGDERHGSKMDSATHQYLHRSVGSVYVSGFAPFGITAGGSGADDQSAVCGVEAGVFFDEDLPHNHPRVETGATIPIIYMSGATGEWKLNEPRIHPMMTGGTGRAAYNLNTAENWTVQEADNGGYVLVHLFGSNSIRYPVIGILGQNQYTNVTDARTGANNEIGNLITTGLPTAEFIPIATLIFGTRNVYTNQSKSIIVQTDLGTDYVDWRTSQITPGAGATDHGSLGGLGDDDHLQYHNDTRAEIWLTGNTHDSFSAGTISGTSLIGTSILNADEVVSTEGLFSTITATTITATTYQGIDFSMVANTSHTHDFSVITNTGHTHTELDITDLGDYAERTYFESHTGDPTTHFTEASIDHTNIQNVGTNTHAQIDTHISNANIHLSLNDVETQITGTTHDVLSAATITATTYQGIDSSMVSNTGHTHDEYLVWDSKSVTFRETRADEDSTLFIVTDEIYIESAMTIMVGTTPTVDWRVMTGTSRTSGTEVFSGQSTGYTTIDYFSGDTTLSTIGTIVWLETTATGGTAVDEFHITIKYSGA